MKRPLLLILALVAIATSVSLLVVRLSGPPTDAGESSVSVAPGRDDPGSQVAAAPDAPAAAELAAPGAGPIERATARPSVAADATPRVEVTGSVQPPAGCAPDDAVEVVVLDREADVDAVLRLLDPQGERAFTPRNPFEGLDGDGADGDDDEDEDDDAPARILGRAPLGADGRYRIDVPADAQDRHVIAIGRSWFGRRTEPVSDGRVDLVTVCGAWIEGAVALPSGRDASEVEDLRVELETDVEGAGGDVRTFRRAHRNAAIRAGRFLFRALDPRHPYDLSASPARLAAAKAHAKELVAGRAKPLELTFRSGGIVRGTVRDMAGAPVPAVQVSANSKGQWFGFDDEPVRIAASGNDGAFEMVGVAAGKLELKAIAAGLLLEKAVPVEVADDATVEGVSIVLGRGATIAGRVTWADGTPAKELAVLASFDRSQMAGMGAFNMLKGAWGEAKTDADGRFTVTGLGPGPFVVEAHALPASESPELAGADKKTKREHEHRARVEMVKPGTEGLALVLQAPTGVRGRVVDAADQPVTAFEIVASGVGDGVMGDVGQERITRDFQSETGEFLLTGLQADRWKVSAGAKGWSASTPVEITTPLAKDAPELVIRLERAATVRGVVRAPDGRTVAGAQVAVDDGNPDWMRAISRTTVPEAKSGPDGAFEMTGLRPGATSLYAQAEGHARSTALALDLAAGQMVEDVVLTLTEGGRITGEVFHEGKAAPGMMVQVQEMKRFSQRMTHTDQKGRFEVEHVDPGSYQVIAMPSRGEGMVSDEGEFDPMSMMSKMKMTTTDVVEGSDVHLVLGAPPEDPVHVTGKVTMAGAPVASATVIFMPEGGKKGLAAFKPVQTKKDGTYTTTLDGPGAYSVSVQRMSAQMDAQSVYEERCVVPKAEQHTLDITLPEARISGRVTGADGKPAVHARVSLVREGAGTPGTMWGGQFHELRTSEDGEYDANGLPAGTYTVMAGGAELGGMLGDGSGSGGGREMKSGVDVGEKDWRQNVDFRLKPPATIEVTVVDESDKPVSGAVVFARDESGRPVDVFSMVSSDGAGQAKYTGLSAGRYTFRARTSTTSSGESASVRVEEGGKSAVKVTLEKGTMILVKVVDGEKLPLVAAVEVLDENGRDLAGQVGLSEIMERFSSGAFDATEQKFGPFPAGKYKVRVTIESGKTSTKTLTLSGQAERKVTLEIE